MNKKLLYILSIILACAIVGTAIFACLGRNERATIFIATDTHYLSSRINDKGEAFQDMIAASDGKMVQYCDEIIDTLGEQAINEQPDVLILSGDLTLNGEKASHEDLVKKLEKIQANGVQVLTIAGNHDINSSNSAEYVKDEIIPAEAITPQEFKELYYNFGMAQAESVDEYSLSYTYKVNKDLYILMLDTNAYGKNYVQDPSYEWIEAQLQSIAKKHARVITVSHQNLFAHNEQLSFGYQLYDAKELLELYNKYEVELNLSGHIHMQHIVSDGITEIATSSLLVSPAQYGVVEIGRNIDYHTEQLDVKSIDNFAQYADDFFKQNGKSKSMEWLEQTDMTDEQKDIVAKTFAELNASYFAGTKLDISPLKSGIDLINQQDGFLKSYIQTMSDEAENDYNQTTIK